MSHDDLVRDIQTRLPHAKIVDVRHSTPEEMRAQRTRPDARTKATLEDELKRDADAQSGDDVLRNSDGSPVRGIAFSAKNAVYLVETFTAPRTFSALPAYHGVYRCQSCGKSTLVPEGEPSRCLFCAKAEICRLRELEAEVAASRSRALADESDAWIEENSVPRPCAECSMPVHVRQRDAGVGLALCGLCRAHLDAELSHGRSRWNRTGSGMDKRLLGGQEILNENLGGIMGFHAHSDIQKRLREKGRLVVSKDENGNPCEYARFTSRKDREKFVREFNSMVKDHPANKKGERKYARHGKEG